LSAGGQTHLTPKASFPSSGFANHPRTGRQAIFSGGALCKASCENISSGVSFTFSKSSVSAIYVWSLRALKLTIISCVKIESHSGSLPWPPADVSLINYSLLLNSGRTRLASSRKPGPAGQRRNFRHYSCNECAYSERLAVSLCAGGADAGGPQRRP